MNTYLLQLQSQPKLRVLPEAYSLINLLASKSLDQTEEFLVAALSWANSTSQNLLAQKLSLLLARHLLFQNRSGEVVALIEPLIPIYKKKDNKTAVLSCALLLAKAHTLASDRAKARSWLVSARATASLVFVPEEKSLELDFLSGVVALGEKQLKTAAGYFAECLERAAKLDSKLAKFEKLSADGRKLEVQEMDLFPEQNLSKRASFLFVLCAALSGKAKEAIITVQKKTEKEVVSLVLLKDLDAAVRKNEIAAYSEILAVFEKNSDTGMESRLAAEAVQHCYEEVLDRKLLKVFNYFSKVPLSYVAKNIGVSEETVEKRLFWFIVNEKSTGKIGLVNGNKVFFSCFKSSSGLETYVEEIELLIKNFRYLSLMKNEQKRKLSEMENGYLNDL